MSYLETARKMMEAARSPDCGEPPSPAPEFVPPAPSRRPRAPEWRRQLLFWPAELWLEWEAATCDLWQGGMENAEAGHLAFERLKPAAPRSRLTLPPTVPTPDCRCDVCDPWPAGTPRPVVKPGCDCVLCAPEAHGYASQVEAARAIYPEAFTSLDRRKAA